MSLESRYRSHKGEASRLKDGEVLEKTDPEEAREREMRTVKEEAISFQD